MESVTAIGHPEGNKLMGTPSSDTVRQHLSKVADSRAFANSPQLRRLLKLLVEASISSPPRRLNPYAIATLALNRNDHFEPVKSSIVRVELRRFRNALAAYYRGEGRDDQIVFNLPVRQYNLTITDQSDAIGGFPQTSLPSTLDAAAIADGEALGTPASTPSPKVRPTITIQHAFNPNEPCYLAVSRFIESAIRFDFFHFRVVDGSDPHNMTRSDYKIRLFSHQNDGSVAFHVEIKTRSGGLVHYRKIYNRRLHSQGSDADTAGIDTKTIDKEVASIFDDRGILPAHYISVMGDCTNLGALILRFYRYFCTLEKDELDFVLRALPDITAEERHDGYYCILMAWICIDQLWRGEKPERAIRNAQLWSIRAVAALPNSAQATYIRSVAAHASGRIDESLRLAEVAHAQNPLDSIVALGLASRKLYSGQPDLARKSLTLAYPHVSTRPQMVSLVICVVAIVLEDDDSLVRTAADIYTETNPMGVAIRVVAAVTSHDHAEGARILANYACTTGEDASFLVQRIRNYFGGFAIGQRIVQRIEQAIALVVPDNQAGRSLDVEKKQQAAPHAEPN